MLNSRPADRRARPQPLRSPKSPSPIDRHVGLRVRMRRLMLDMSQTELGNALGLTFQQIQKYEKGANRIGASRLQQIAQVLQVPVTFFFDGAPNAPAPSGQATQVSPSTAYVSEFVASSEGLALIKAFGQLKDAKLRRLLVHLVEQLVRDHER